MALRDDFNEALEPQSRQCKLCTLINGMDVADGEAVQGSSARGASAEKIEAVLRKNGYDVGRSTIAKHFKESHEPFKRYE